MQRELIIPTLDVLVALPEAKEQDEFNFKEACEYWVDLLEEYKAIFGITKVTFERENRNPKTGKSMVTVRVEGVDGSSFQRLYGFTPTFVGEIFYEAVL